MDIPYRQLSPREALRTYCDWLLEQRITEPFHFLRCVEGKMQCAEWYMISYPLRTLMLGTRVLGDDGYLRAALPFIELYLTEQLPNGGFTSNYRRTPSAQLGKKAFHEILRTGKVNLADNGSNITSLIQAAMATSGETRERYLKAARRWLDEWVPLWALPEGGYGNGIWKGHKLNSPYTCAIGTVCAALSAFTLATGEREFVENAQRAILFQCDHWLPDGRPIALDCYPLPRKSALDDYGHSFYLLEGMCWTHAASTDETLRQRVAERLKLWIFGEKGLLSQWRNGWFNFQTVAYPPDWEVEPSLPMSRIGIRAGWELAKANGIVHFLAYYLRHIADDPTLRAAVQEGIEHLSHPLHARMGGVASDPLRSYGSFAVQATGFAGLSLADAIEPDSVFRCVTRK
jgi:hypothetical protein